MKEESAAARRGWLQRLKAGLGRTSSKLSDGIGGILVKRKLDAATLEALEELLIAADLGPATAARLVGKLSANRFGSDMTADQVRESLAADIAEALEPVATQLEIDPKK